MRDVENRSRMRSAPSRPSSARRVGSSLNRASSQRGRRRRRSARLIPSRRHRQPFHVPPRRSPPRGRRQRAPRSPRPGCPHLPRRGGMRRTPRTMPRRRGDTRAAANDRSLRVTARVLRRPDGPRRRRSGRRQSRRARGDPHEIERPLDRGQSTDPPDDECVFRGADLVSSTSTFLGCRRCPRIEVEPVPHHIELLGWGDVVADQVVPHFVADRDQAIRQMGKATLDQTKDLLDGWARSSRSEHGHGTRAPPPRSGTTECRGCDASDCACLGGVRVHHVGLLTANQLAELANRSDVGTKRQLALE